MGKKIIVVNGDMTTPARFWNWMVCYESEFTERFKKAGCVESKCTKYLTLKQLAFLNS